MRKKTLNPVNQMEEEAAQIQKISEYEQSREDRIKENLNRMKNLGLVDLSMKLHSSSVTRKTKPRKPSDQETIRKSYSVESLEPPRRSSRLQRVTPISYSEVPLLKKDKSFEDEGIMLEEGSKPEIYTEEHDKLLGSTERSWILFVDGVGKDGKRIYDQVNGKTCHQCRQKTLGHRTNCSRCEMVQGQFCGDCLYMRYGEHVLEALENPDWLCPVCRGICNCSLCRKTKGWPATGILYKKISSMGYRSVAHFLIQTRRAPANKVSAKRSLPFSNLEAMHLGLDNRFEDKRVDELRNEKSCPISEKDDQISAEKFTSFPIKIDYNADEKGQKEQEKMEISRQSEKKLAAAVEDTSDSIGRRLRLRRRGDNEKENGTHDESAKDYALNDNVKAKEMEKKQKTEGKKRINVVELSIAGRLRPRRKEIDDNSRLGFGKIKEET